VAVAALDALDDDFAVRARCRDLAEGASSARRRMPRQLPRRHELDEVERRMA